jgi:hypothetical protein
MVYIKTTLMANLAIFNQSVRDLYRDIIERQLGHLFNEVLDNLRLVTTTTHILIQSHKVIIKSNRIIQ